MHPPRSDERELWAWDEARAPRPVEGRFARGWRLANECWQVLWTHPQLLVLPVISAVATLLAGLLVLGPVLWWARDHGGRWPYGVAIVLGAYLLNFTSTFFGVAFVSAAGRTFRGEPADIRAGLGHAVRRAGPIAAWALVATAVEIILHALQRVRGGFVVNVVVHWILGAAWALATLFVIPAIACDDVGPVEAARRSIAVIRKRWGEGVSGSVFVGILFLLVLVPAVILGAFGYAVFGSAPALGVGLIAIAALVFVTAVTVQWAMTNLFRLALYRYATEGEVVGPFGEHDLSDAFHVQVGGLRSRFRR